MACDIQIIIGQQPFKMIEEQLKRKYYFIKNIEPVKNEMLGYLGQYFFLHGTKIDSNNQTSDFNFFLKKVPSSEVQKNFIKKSGVFNNEIAIYKLLFPLMGFKKKPDFILDSPNNFLLLQNLKPKGYQIMEKLKPFNLKFCKIVLKTMADFHSKSFIYEQKNYILDFFEENKLDLYLPDHLMEGAIKTNINGVCAIIDFIANSQCCKKSEQWNKVKNILCKEANDYYSNLRNAIPGKKVLCHCDLWSNNLLFQMDAEQNPQDCCLVDFQLCR